MQAESVTVHNPDGCRRLLAAILKQAVRDAELAAPPPGWPWRDWHPQAELAAFWRSEWLEALCDWLDLDAERVRAWAKAHNGGASRVIQLSLWDLWEWSDGHEDER